MSNIYVYDGESVRALQAPAQRPLRWAAWRPDGEYALLAGNRGQVLRYDGERFEPLATGVAHNLRGVGWSPDGERALLAGNRGAVLLYDGRQFRELARATMENLRRVAWSPDGRRAVIVGNGGTVLRYDAGDGELVPLPGDRAHTMRSVAWRPDGAYALIGGYATQRAGYPQPYLLYRCDGRFVQGVLTSDDEDDTVAIDWRPGTDSPAAVALVATYGDGGSVSNKLIEYDGSSLTLRELDAPSALLGGAWRPDGASMLFCGERGALLTLEPGGGLQPVASGTTDTLVGPFWRAGSRPLALLLRGPGEKVYTI